MRRRRVAIACQGGGSQCAFVAGALRTLLARGVQHRFEIVGLSGTSGGALTAAMAWIGLLDEAHGGQRPAHDRIGALWRDLTAQTPQEIVLDGVCVETLRLVERGLLPSVASSPSSLSFQLWLQAASRLVGRPEFTDLRALLLKHIDFDALPGLVRPDSPVLLVGACDVLQGSFKVFSSANREIQVESLLASAAVPTLFPAVRIGEQAYWDGIFSSNPPVFAFLQKRFLGKEGLPDEVWIIQVNPKEQDSVPDAPSEIFDRRNHLAGNLSLQHELQMLEMVNLLIAEGALTDEFRSRFGIDTTEPISVRFIRMSADLQKTLDYPSKLSRQPAHISRLMADGEAQARAFLAALESSDRLEPTAQEPSVELH
jgi:NTE family protein